MGLVSHLKKKFEKRQDDEFEAPFEAPENDDGEEAVTALVPNTDVYTPGYKSVVYFCNWAIYDRKHFPKDLPVQHMTHILYSFADVDPTGAVKLSDPWADTDCMLGGNNAASSSGVNNGCFGEFHRLKRENRHLRILLSVGGWTFSPNFGQGVNTPEKRANFAKTAAALVDSLEIDGIDLDWEYAEGPEKARNYVDLCRLVRLELDSLALRQNLPRNQFDVTVAAPGGEEQLQHLFIGDMDPYLTFWNLMTYDFAGPWSSQTTYHSNLYRGTLSADRTVNSYLSRGAKREKLVLGAPIYGRGFYETTGVGQSFNGTGPGTWEQGVYDYKLLPPPGAVETVDRTAWAAYSYDRNTQTLITYDNPETIAVKAQYVIDHGLAGGMFWESSADYPVDHPRSLIGTFTRMLGNLEMKPNYIKDS
ncbi:hypothetical protein TRVA0_019S00584 [Trichomonascus vanleenenianus]|uniref:putative chitinase n=1 Tax=Trichomonascus vanleenenianus TaxID=2268995 RepID=UPI003ECAA7C1